MGTWPHTIPVHMSIVFKIFIQTRSYVQRQIASFSEDTKQQYSFKTTTSILMAFFAGHPE